MTTYRPIDSKREEFRKYLERAGVMDALTKCLVSLYEEADKPDDALDYVRKHLGGERSEQSESVALKMQIEEFQTRIKELEEENATLKGAADPLAEVPAEVDGAEVPPDE